MRVTWKHAALSLILVTVSFLFLTLANWHMTTLPFNTYVNDCPAGKNDILFIGATNPLSADEQSWVDTLRGMGYNVTVHAYFAFGSDDLQNKELVVCYDKAWASDYQSICGNLLATPHALRTYYDDGHPIMEVFGTSGAERLGYYPAGFTNAIGDMGYSGDYGIYNSAHSIGSSLATGGFLSTQTNSYNITQMASGFTWIVKSGWNNDTCETITDENECVPPAVYLVQARDAVGGQGRYVLFNWRYTALTNSNFTMLLQRNVNWAITGDANKPCTTVCASDADCPLITPKCDNGVCKEIFLPECTNDTDCHQCFAKCNNYRCVVNETQPSQPCPDAIWENYPVCKWVGDCWKNCTKECCLNEPFTFNKTCSVGKTCVNNVCQSSCTKECCVNETSTPDKLCPEGRVCVNGACKTNFVIDWTVVLFGIMFLFGSFLVIIYLYSWRTKH